MAIAATGLVIVLPAAVVAALVPRGGLAMALVSALGAIAISLLLATAGAALWKRQPRSRDVVFADLMLWCWVRRYLTERRLSQARELFDAARRAGPLVNIELLLGLSRLLEARDAYVHGHSQRVARHAVRIARAMHLSERQVAKIRTAAEVHDVGKIYTPRAILNNPDKLTEGEFALIKQHTTCGAEMLSVVGDPEITAIVRHHHERIDGEGYPDGLAGSAIPLGARIIAVADTFDAITSDRPYRGAGSQKHALKILSTEAGAQLDADAVAAFEHDYSARRSVGWAALGAIAVQRAAAAISSLSAGGASVAALAPALGAAGVLAVSPGLFRVSRAAQPANGSPTLLQPLLASGEASAGQGGQTPAGGSTGASGKAPNIHAGLGPAVGHSRSPASGAAPSGSTPAITTNAQTREGAGTSTGGQGRGSSPEAPAPSPLPPVGGTPRVPAPPPVGPVTVPSVSTPTVGTPAITTPSVTTPTVSVPGVTVPSVTVPSVTAPPLTLHP